MLTRKFYINFGLFLFACVALALSIWAFLKPCKNDSFKNIDDLPPYDIKASTNIKLPKNKYGTVNFATGVRGQQPSQNEKENAQSLLYIAGVDCLLCYQYKRGSMPSNFFNDNSFNDSIIDPNNKLPANHLINLGIDGLTYTSDLPCDTLTRLRKQECD